VSVTTGFWCVDLHEFYTSKEGDLKPKQEGIALRLNEWTQVCDLRDQLNNNMNLLLSQLSQPVVGEQNDSLSQFLREYRADSSAYSQLVMAANVINLLGQSISLLPEWLEQPTLQKREVFKVDAVCRGLFSF